MSENVEAKNYIIQELKCQLEHNKLNELNEPNENNSIGLNQVF
jgi:hypothetical protein